MPKAFITDCDGTELTSTERSFLRDERPWGFIVFARNVRDRTQLADLVSDFRECVGAPSAPVLVDQEGGRVQRLCSPEWRDYESPGLFGSFYSASPERALRGAELHGRLIGQELREVGIDVDCLPCLDVPVAGAHEVIGDRALSSDVKVVQALGRRMIDGLRRSGVLPVIKHMPGHGRADADTHHDLPRIAAHPDTLDRQDYEAFRPFADEAMGMTAHVVLEYVDHERPVTQSARAIETVIRQTIGFDGLLMTDDLSMNALKGSHEQRARACLDAGVDIVLHCNATLDQRIAVASACPELAGERKRRAERVRRPVPEPFDVAAAWDELQEIYKVEMAA